MATHKAAASAILDAVHDRITTDPSTSSYRCYNYVPSSTAFPYIALSDVMGAKSLSWTSQDIKGQDVTITAHIWSSYHGDKQAGDMMDAVAQAVTATDLSITGYTTLKAVVDFYQIMIEDSDPDRILRHGVLRFRFHVA